MSERPEKGSAPLETLFAMALLLVLVLGVVEIAFVLYGRNVVQASVHEGARAAIELGRAPSEGAALAHRTVRRAAGGLVDGLRVDVAVEESAARVSVRVRARGTLAPLLPVPLPLPIVATATSSRPAL